MMASRASDGPVRALSSKVDEETSCAVEVTALMRVEFGKNGSFTLPPATVNADWGISGSGGTVGSGAAPAARASGRYAAAAMTRDATKHDVKALEIFMVFIGSWDVGFDQGHDFHVERELFPFVWSGATARFKTQVLHAHVGKMVFKIGQEF